uniref:SCP domain-containing protein n=1 Tax=Macrostomum lignano TaxID=282301 RepID=A0A1I8GBR9_9PLAT
RRYESSAVRFPSRLRVSMSRDIMQLKFLQMLPLLMLLLPLLLLPANVNAALSASQKTEFVNIHNRLREAVYPRATKMNFLSLAQAASEKCKFEHNYGGDYEGLGENIYMGYRTNVSEITLAWHIEKAIYNYNTTSCNPAGKLTTCGHYVQLISDGVLEVGCGHYVCSGSNLVFCEYSSGSKVYTSGGSACSKCPSYRGLCLNGMCVNSSMVSQSDVQAYNPGAKVSSTKCKLNCSNCGVSESIPGSLDCYCKCASGIGTGAYCENRVADSKSTCSVCSNLTTPCLNGGTDLKGASCACQCPATFVGPRCQVYRQFYLNGMRLSIIAEQFCAFDRCLQVPVTRTMFKTSIWSRLRPAVAQAINAFCTASEANFALCCPSAARQTPSADKKLIADADVGYLDNEDMFTDNVGLLGVVVYANSSSTANTLCPAARRRRSTLQAMVAQSVLQSAIQQFNSTVSGNLSSCCGVTVRSAVTYNSYVKYNVEEII